MANIAIKLISCITHTKDLQRGSDEIWYGKMLEKCAAHL